MKKVLYLFIAFALFGCSNNQIKSSKNYEKDSLKYYTEYEYSDSGDLINEKIYGLDGRLKFENKYYSNKKEFNKIDRLELSASKKVIYADSEDSLKFNVDAYNSDGDKISSDDVEIYINDEKYNKKKFKTSEVGEYIVKAKYGDLESNTIYFRSRDYKNPVTGDYLEFFNHKNIHNIELKINREEWDRLLNSLKENKSSEEYVKADMVYKGELGTKNLNSVGFRVRGNASRGLPENDGIYTKAPFKIKFDETFNLEKEDKEYSKVKERKLFEMSSMNLKWNRRYDDSQIREHFNYELLRKAGITVPKTASVLLKINIDGEIHNYGLYTAVEAIDKDFVNKNYGMLNNRGNLYKCLYPASLSLWSIMNEYAIGLEKPEIGYRPIYDLKTNKKKKDYSDIKDFIQAVDYFKKDSLKIYLDEHFEIDKFLRYMAMNHLIGMFDDYRDNMNNFYLYFPKGGKADFIPYDYDSGIGGGWPGWRFDDIANADIYRDSSNSILCTKVLGVDEYRKQYEKYLEEFAAYENGLFSYENFEKKYYEMYKVYNGKIENEIHQGDEMKLDPIIEKFFAEKLKSTRDQLGMQPQVIRPPRNPDTSIKDIDEFLARLKVMKPENRDQFVYDNFRTIASKTEFPLVKGNRVTFIYDSNGKKMDRVELRGEMNGWGFEKSSQEYFDSLVFKKIEGTNLYIYEIGLEKGSYEYKIVNNRIKINYTEFQKLSDEEKMKVAGKMDWMDDELNPKQRLGGFGANSLVIVE